MKIFKNYACHRVYDSPQHYLTQSVVSIADNGEVMKCKPLSQETAFTEWIGGAIVLSPESEITLPIDFKTLRQQSTKGNESSPFMLGISLISIFRKKPRLPKASSDVYRSPSELGTNNRRSHGYIQGFGCFPLRRIIRDV